MEGKAKKKKLTKGRVEKFGEKIYFCTLSLLPQKLSKLHNPPVSVVF
jgi:hypothetical protein